LFDIQLTEAAKDDPIFSQLPNTFKVGHWHNDMPGLPKDAVILAKSEGCPRQVIRFTPKVYGLQCHFEFTKESVNDLMGMCAHEIDGSRYVQSTEQILNNDYSEGNRLLFKILDGLTKQ